MTGGAANSHAHLAGRFSNVQTFTGRITQGSQVVIVDDTFTTGNTLTSLIDHLMAQQADIRSVTTLADSVSHNFLKQRPQDTAKLLAKADTTEAEFARALGFPIGRLTGSEVYRLAHLAKWSGTAGLRERLGLPQDGGRSGASPEGAGRAGSAASLASATSARQPFYSRLERAIDAADFGTSKTKPPMQWQGVIASPSILFSATSIPPAPRRSLTMNCLGKSARKRDVWNSPAPAMKTNGNSSSISRNQFWEAWHREEVEAGRMSDDLPVYKSSASDSPPTSSPTPRSIYSAKQYPAPKTSR